MQTITCDLTPGGTPPKVRVSQNDNQREIAFNILEDGEQCILPEGAEIYLKIITPDKREVMTQGELSGDQYIFVIGEDVTCSPGVAEAKLKVKNGSMNIGSQLVVMEIERSPI